MSGIHYNLWLTLECHNEDTNEAIDMITPVCLGDLTDPEEASKRLQSIIDQFAPGSTVYPAGYNPFFPPK